MLNKCQFLIGNVSQLILSVSINDTTPLSPKNQYKTVKKSVDLQHHNINKSLICKDLAIYHYSSLTSTDFPVQNQANFLKKTIFRDKKDRLNHMFIGFLGRRTFGVQVTFVFTSNHPFNTLSSAAARPANRDNLNLSVVKSAVKFYIITAKIAT